MVRLNRLVALSAIGLALLISLAACDLPGISTTTPVIAQQNNGTLDWPFDIHAGAWFIENGYNTGPDYSGYEVYSFDFQRRDTTTTGQPILSPATGDLIDFGSAYPFDDSSGHCGRLSVEGYSGYYVMVCHLVSVAARHVHRGDPMGTVAGGPNGDHIHITRYSLAPGIPDTKDHAGDRKAMPFSAPWTIAGRSYPASGTANEWGRTPVPCGTQASAKTATPTAAPHSTTCATNGSTFFDDFSHDTPGQPPTGYNLRGASGVSPVVVEVGGAGAASRVINFPAVSGQYWDRWVLGNQLFLCPPYFITVNLDFQSRVADRRGITIGWNDKNWDRIDIQPNVYWGDIEFRVTYAGPVHSSVTTTGIAMQQGGLSIQAGTAYWMRVEVTGSRLGSETVTVSWSADGANFTPVEVATGIPDARGPAGMSTAGPNLPTVDFDDFTERSG